MDNNPIRCDTKANNVSLGKFIVVGFPSKSQSWAPAEIGLHTPQINGRVVSAKIFKDLLRSILHFAKYVRAQICFEKWWNNCGWCTTSCLRPPVSRLTNPPTYQPTNQPTQINRHWHCHPPLRLHLQYFVQMHQHIYLCFSKLSQWVSNSLELAHLQGYKHVFQEAHDRDDYIG